MTDDPTPPHELWREAIAPRLSLSPEVAFEEKPEGYSTRVYFARTREGEFALRLYRPGGRSRLVNYSKANRAFRRFGVLAPKIRGTGREGDTLWLLEDRIAGTSVRDLLDEPETVTRCAKALAFLHGHERNRYGELGALGGFRLGLRWRQRLPERWRKITRLFPELERTTGEVEDWFEDWSNSFAPTRYQLLHGDFHPGNLSRTTEGEIAFLDLRTPRYGFGLLEMIEAAHHFLGEEPEDWAPFCEAYLADRDEDTRRLYEEFGPSLHAVFHLRHADRFADLAIGHRGELEDRRRWERNAADSWSKFCSIAGIETEEIEVQTESAFSGLRG